MLRKIVKEHISQMSHTHLPLHRDLVPSSVSPPREDVRARQVAPCVGDLLELLPHEAVVPDPRAAR